jgi:dTDP-4-amino-4,6-dideoxygalactose transaminase
MSTNQPIPFLDLVTPHRALEEQLVEVFRNALSTAGFIGGPRVEEFEQDFACFCGTEYCVGVGSGTDALRFALIASGVERGDLVITVPNTFIASTEAISQAGARPDFVDVDERTRNMDAHKLAEYLETKCSFDPQRHETLHYPSGRVVRAIIPVHLYGQTADMDPILRLANKYNIVVIEDACQAHGAEYYSRRDVCWKQAGSMGLAGAFSFYPGKNLGACGEAGVVTTHDERIARKIRMLRDHGQAKKYYHDIEGYNGRLDSIQAAILRVKLAHLPSWNKLRQERAAEYKRLLGDAGNPAVAPHEPSWARAVYHLYVVRVNDRERLIASLNSQGIGTGIHYPIPLHLQSAYHSLGYGPGAFPISEKLATEIVSLPMFPQITSAQQARVVSEIAHFANSTTSALSLSDRVHSSSHSGCY